MSEWISVKERLPDKGAEFLVYQPRQFSMNTLMHDRITVLRWTGKKWVSSLIVTHWMPLPEPPKEVA